MEPIREIILFLYILSLMIESLTEAPPLAEEVPKREREREDLVSV